VLYLEELLLRAVCVLVNVAFVTLIERKALSLIQARVGPNKVGAYGALQPAADAVKLFTNRITMLGPINKVFYFIRPIISVVLIVLFCHFSCSFFSARSSRLRVFFLLMLLSLNVYPLLGAGWGSNSKYAILGGLRAAAQTISYEISLAFIVAAIILIWKRPRLSAGRLRLRLSGRILPALALFLPWVISCTAELNRTPFDFAEGESELVSGFNIEYGSVKFAIIFIAEYGIIFILSLLTSYLFFFPNLRNHLGRRLLGILFVFVVIWLRATLPRFRYDLLMLVTWKSLLPASLGLCQAVAALLFNTL